MMDEEDDQDNHIQDKEADRSGRAADKDNGRLLCHAETGRQHDLLKGNVTTGTRRSLKEY